MFAQDDKQSDPAALEHQQMNSDEVRVNIRHVLIGEMMNVAKARTCTHTCWFYSRGQALAPAGTSTAWKREQQCQQCFGNAELLRSEQWRHWLLTGLQPVWTVKLVLAFSERLFLLREAAKRSSVWDLVDSKTQRVRDYAISSIVSELQIKHVWNVCGES